MNLGSTKPILYPISAVSRLTGITVHTLRMWERRYGLKPSQRSETKRRLYDQKDIERLILLKSLIERGQNIGRIAGMSLNDLEQLLFEMEQTRFKRSANRPVIEIQLALFGNTSCERIATDLAYFGDIKILLQSDHFHGNEHLLKTHGLDVAVIEQPTLHIETLHNFQTICTQQSFHNIVILYNYAAQTTVRRFRENGFLLLRMPVCAEEVRLACLSVSLKAFKSPFDNTKSPISNIHTPFGNQEAPAPRFDATTLRAFETAKSAVECECPKHLVEIIRSLTAFELYSKQCEHRDEKDAALHAYLGNITGHARALMETALERVAAEEKLLPSSDKSAISTYN